MHLINPISLNLITSISAFSITLDGPGTFVPPPKSVVLSALRAVASSQVTSPPLASALRQLPASQISGHNIPSDIAAAADQIIYSHDLSHMPGWLSAAPTDGPIASALNADIAFAEETRINGASLLTATGSAASAILASASAENGGSSFTATTISSSSTVTKMGTSSTTSSGTSTVTSGGSTTTSSSTQTSSVSSSGSTGGAQGGRATGVGMVVGMLAAGVVGVVGGL